MKLISMTEFVLQHKENVEFHLNDTVLETGKLMQRFFKYADFLRQPLTLGMFVPVDEEGDVLKNPHARDEDAGTEKEELQIEFNNALEKVLFEGFELKGTSITDGNNDVYFMGNDGKFRKHCLMSDTVEYMVYWKLELTPSALKQIGL